ncbi:MAG: NTP transferase domain-containing protein [Candidatus Omnitrophica bacterium]|nr:NTP transferase domain-containing protein [Candidatus Omnitrophota bacterium]
MAKVKNTACIILAAGKGTRMRSSLPKVLHKICGKTMIEHVLKLAEPFGFKPTIVVTGYKGKDVAKAAKGAAKIINQKKQLGSADAVMSAEAAISKFSGDVIVMYGDIPLIRRETLKQVLLRHKAKGAACTLLTAKLRDPSGYGRVLRDENNEVVSIIEETDLSFNDRAVNETNVGAYCFDGKALFEALKEVKINKNKKEYYLTDVISILKNKGLKIEAFSTKNEDEGMGINSRGELAAAERVARSRVLEKFMDHGVTIEDPSTTYIDPGCVIGADTLIRPFTMIEENVKIGQNCAVGPFARLRAGTRLSDGVEVGNFVEVARSYVGGGTKIKHHSYIGDSVIGKDVNVGAGTITANYDGKNKNKTIIKDGAFIGSGTILVAPVTVGKKAVTGAGAVLTRKTKVPDSSVIVGIPGRILKK